jgi:hypothetical protein
MRRERMRTGWLLIGLLLVVGAGCARRDWVGHMLALTDVTGTWTGSLTYNYTARNPTAVTQMRLTLSQSGSYVTGE